MRSLIAASPVLGCVFVCLVGLTRSALAETTGTSRSSSEYELMGGALLPSKISGVKEVLPLWGARAGLRTKRGFFEADAALANAGGVSYDAFTFDYRYDVETDVAPAFFLLGVQSDLYQSPNGDPKVSGGWNFGGGVFLPLAGDLWLRSDVRYRFGPGTSLMILLGLSLRLPEGGPG